MRKFGMHGFAAKKAIYGCDLCVSHIPPGFVFVLFFFFSLGIVSSVGLMKACTLFVLLVMACASHCSAEHFCR